MKKTFSILLFLLTFTVFAQIDRSQQPQPGPAPVIQLGEPERFTLNNGLTVLIVENNKLPRAAVSLSLDNSPIAEGELAGVSAMTATLLGKGSATIDKDSFNEEVDFMGATINFGSQSASASSLSRYFGRVLELMAEAALHPNFTQEEFDKEKDILLDGIKSGEKSVTTAARRVENLLAYGKDHPYGEYVSKESVERVKLADVDAFYKRYFLPNNAYLVIVGDVDAGDLKKQVKKLFGKWKKKNLSTDPIPDVTNVSTTQIDFVNMPNAVQTEVTVQNTVSLRKKDADYFPLLIANGILGGGGEARLFLNLREDKGYTYGSYSSIGNNKYTASRFRASASVRNAVVDSAVVELLYEIDRMKKEVVSDEELNRAKAKYVGSFVRAVEQPSTVAAYALEIETEGLPDDFYTTYLESVNSVTKEDIQRVAQKYFLVDQARVVVTGKASEVLDNLEKVQFNESDIFVSYYDKYGNVIDRPASFELPDGVSAQSILADYIDAIGGQDAINAIRSLEVSYNANFMGNELEAISINTAEEQKQIVKMGGNVLATVIVNASGAKVEQMGNSMDLPPEMAADMQAVIGIIPELKMMENESITVSGIEEIDGQSAYALEIKGQSTTTTTYYAVESGLKLKQTTVTELMGQTQTQDSNYNDYKRFGSLLIPSSTSVPLGPQSVDATLGYVKINGEAVDTE
ncbi:MAG: peptidase M16 [Flavobacteriaceae bacterium]|nr:peptidase M16 [Flavobacteriaceae bacterium]|tara:strand:- start:1747 stop:3813 length:2067 start_codon:yes stop_codon:yes gene_type:complete